MGTAVRMADLTHNKNTLSYNKLVKIHPTKFQQNLIVMHKEVRGRIVGTYFSFKKTRYFKQNF